MGDYLSSRGDISAKTIESMVFDMDSNGDGHIDLHEWRRAWKTFGKDRSAEEEVEQPLAAPRTRVTFAREIDEPTTAPNAAGVAGAEALRKALLSQVLRVIDLFRKLDANNDGKVSSAEFRRVLPLLATAGVLNAASFAEADVDSLFALLDLDGSGSIEYSELHKRLRQGLSVTLDQKLQAGDQLDHLLAAAAALKTPTWQQAWQQAAETTQRVKASARPERDVRAPILPAALRLDKGRSSNPAYWDKDHIERTLVQPWGGPPSDHYN
ncbi:calmodulin-domain protein kinase 1 [Chrysochromulina tobinii]|uniref:Calmodulin-domain protein kinase 1 n=1 Tax=Chrysochromulina tobinii TaxID=1460289 RepID=A0A0M0JJG3_9EUKA|nr:calmodulin-domain protein kinase 1 [Chrysochromulina tobinii]|eukprot:KOO26741.1 calmodulin-domain protein kinase 1 [Chrysochromulina sp. CCMP291]